MNGKVAAGAEDATLPEAWCDNVLGGIQRVPTKESVHIEIIAFIESGSIAFPGQWYLAHAKTLPAFCNLCERLALNDLPLRTGAGLESGKFYKGESQQKTRRRGRIFSYFPARIVEQDLF